MLLKSGQKLYVLAQAGQGQFREKVMSKTMTEIIGGNKKRDGKSLVTLRISTGIVFPIFFSTSESKTLDLPVPILRRPLQVLLSVVSESAAQMPSNPSVLAAGRTEQLGLRVG